MKRKRVGIVSSNRSKVNDRCITNLPSPVSASSEANVASPLAARSLSALASNSLSAQTASNLPAEVVDDGPITETQSAAMLSAMNMACDPNVERNLEGFGSPAKTLVLESIDDENTLSKKMNEKNSQKVSSMMNSSYRSGSKNTQSSYDPWKRDFIQFCETYTVLLRGEDGKEEVVLRPLEPPYARKEYVMEFIHNYALPRGQRSSNAPLSVANFKHSARH